MVAGLGGRPVTVASVRGLLDDVLADRLDPLGLHFLGLDTALVERELDRARGLDRPGRTRSTCCATSAPRPRPSDHARST